MKQILSSNFAAKAIKSTSILLMLAVVFSFSACGRKGDPVSPKQTQPYQYPNPSVQAE